MISDANARILSWLLENGRCVFSDDPMPEYVTMFRLDELIADGLVYSPVHPSGVSVYQITPSGEDALQEYRKAIEQLAADIAENDAEKKRMIMERRADIRREWLFFILGLVVGWLLGAVTPLQAWEWIVGLLH